MYIYFFIQQSLMTLKHPLVAEFPMSRYSNRDIFWSKNIKLIKIITTKMIFFINALNIMKNNLHILLICNIRKD